MYFDEKNTGIEGYNIIVYSVKGLYTTRKLLISEVSTIDTVCSLT